MTDKKLAKTYTYKFSFVIPVYNVEDYLAETVESILAQTMDFEQNCEIIFVNDGSTDNSEEVCLRYKEQFPQNIKYIAQSNQGVSAARNNGLQEVEGKYVSFLDSDDKISPDTLEKVYDFFEKHYEEIDFVSIKLVFFDSREGDHPLNYKYETSRVINIEDDYSYVQLSGGSVFVKSTAFDRGHIFDKRVKVSEDAKLLTEIVMEKCAYGVVAEPTYFYRKRKSATSAIGGSLASKDWYFNPPKLVYDNLLESFKDPAGKIPRYIQYLVMYDLQWRFKQRYQSVLTYTELQDYKELLFGLIRKIDDDIILDQKSIQDEHKIFLLSRKYNITPDKLLSFDSDGRATYNTTTIYDYSDKRPYIHMEIVTLCENKIKIEGYFNGIMSPEVQLGFMCGGKWFNVKRVSRPLIEVRFLDEIVFDRNPFEVEIDIAAGDIIQPYAKMKASYFPVRLIARFTSRFTHTTGYSYRKAKSYIAVLDGSTFIRIQKKTIFREILREYKRQRELIVNGVILLALLRTISLTVKKCMRKPIWVITDRTESAGDNGEAFFRYMSSLPNIPANTYFAISKNSSDYQRLKKYGRVINRNSRLYKVLFLASDKIISSHADASVINPFGNAYPHLVDIYDHDFVFLQHGIIKDDLSAWLNRYNKNIQLFITSAKPEYQSVLEEDYSYTKDVVKLTGLPRFDLLDNNPQGKIIIAPTWRRALERPIDPTTGEREYNNSFKYSDFYKFYQNLLQDERILGALEQYNMQIEFYLHPSLSTQTSDFHGSSRARIMLPPYSYKNAFEQGNLLVTDYSSVAFDFAYLHKPVIYAQFDRKSFYEGQIYSEGYFVYERDGLGCVVYDYDSTVAAIINSIHDRFKVAEKYQKRIKKFYAYTDRNNAQRVYRAIQELQNTNGCELYDIHA